MKHTISVVLILITSSCFAQFRSFVKAGGSLNYVQGTELNAGQMLGYYAGVGLQQRDYDFLALSADLYYLDQVNKVDDFSISIKSVNTIFSLNFFPVPEFRNLYLLVGIECGYTFDTKLNGENAEDENHDIRFGPVFGLAFDITDKFQFETRYARESKGPGFMYTIQAGVNYRLSKQQSRVE